MKDPLELPDEEVTQLAEIEDKPIVARESTSQPVVVNNATSMLQVIGQLSMNPDVDIDKVERLMAMQEKLQAKENEDAFNRFLASAQGKMDKVVKNKKNTQTNSTYADLGAIVDMAQPIYTGEGISLSFNTEKSEDASIVRVVCFVSAAGHTRRYEYDSPITDKGTGGKVMMTPQHARGSAISYGRRYLTCMIFNIPTGDDDDGNASTGNRQTAPQTYGPKYNADQKATFDRIIRDEDAIAAYLLSISIDEGIWTDLYNSGNKGEKMALKTKCNELVKMGHNMVKNIETALENGDAVLAIENYDCSATGEGLLRRHLGREGIENLQELTEENQ